MQVVARRERQAADILGTPGTLSPVDHMFRVGTTVSAIAYFLSFRTQDHADKTAANSIAAMASAGGGGHLNGRKIFEQAGSQARRITRLTERPPPSLRGAVLRTVL